MLLAVTLVGVVQATTVVNVADTQEEAKPPPQALRTSNS